MFSSYLNKGIWVKSSLVEAEGWWHRALGLTVLSPFLGCILLALGWCKIAVRGVTTSVIYLYWKFKLIRELPYHHPITRKLSDSLSRNSTGSVKLGLPFCSGSGSLQQLWLWQQEHLLQMSGMHWVIKRKTYNFTAIRLSPVWSRIQ